MCVREDVKMVLNDNFLLWYEAGQHRFEVDAKIIDYS